MIPWFVYADSTWDKYTIDPASPWQKFFRWRATMMTGYTPWFDVAMKYFPGPAGFYTDSYAINKDAQGNNPAPSQTLVDAAGNQLFVQYACANGTCSQF